MTLSEQIAAADAVFKAGQWDEGAELLAAVYDDAVRVEERELAREACKRLIELHTNAALEICRIERPTKADVSRHERHYFEQQRWIETRRRLDSLE